MSCSASSCQKAAIPLGDYLSFSARNSSGQIDNGRTPDPLPPKWPSHSSSEGIPKLGYQALYQRALGRKIKPGGKIQRLYGDALRVALSGALELPLPKLLFRQEEIRAPSEAMDADPPLFYSDIITKRHNDEALSTCSYIVVARDINLGADLPSFPERLSGTSDFLEQIPLDLINELHLPVGDEGLAFARLARFIAAGLLEGMQLRLCYTQAIHSLRLVPQPLANIDELSKRSLFRMRVLAHAGGYKYSGHSILDFIDNRFLDTATWLHLSRAERSYRDHAANAIKEVEGRTTKYEDSLCKRLFVHDISKPQTVIDPALQLLSSLPLRIMLEKGRDLSDPGVRAYLWIKFLDQPNKKSTERLLALDLATSIDLNRIFSSIEELT